MNLADLRLTACHARAGALRSAPMASGSKKVIVAALIGNALITVTKFVAAALTGSAAMFSEGVHSSVDTGNQFLLTMAAAASHPVSRQWKGYWQRATCSNL